MLHDDVHDFVAYVNGYYRLQVTHANGGDGDDDEGLVIKTADQRSSSSENGNELT